MSTLGKRQRSFATDWLYINYAIITLGITLRIVLIMLQLLEVLPMLNFWSANFLTIAVMVILYIVAYRHSRLKHATFILYDNGIKVIQNNQEDLFYWTDITHFDGVRHTQSFNAIIVIKYGANIFFQGDKELFRVGVLTMRAGTLVDFIISKLNENRLPQLIEAYEAPNDINFSSFWLNKNGLGNTNKWIKWDEIKEVQMKRGNNPTLKIKTIHNDKFQKFENVYYGEQYSVLALIDYVLGTAYLPQAQEYMMNYSQQFKDGVKTVLPIAIVGTVVLLGVIVLLSSVSK